jgi:hypothetical protein
VKGILFFFRKMAKAEAENPQFQYWIEAVYRQDLAALNELRDQGAPAVPPYGSPCSIYDSDIKNTLGRFHHVNEYMITCLWYLAAVMGKYNGAKAFEILQWLVENEQRKPRDQWRSFEGDLMNGLLSWVTTDQFDYFHTSGVVPWGYATLFSSIVLHDNIINEKQTENCVPFRHLWDHDIPLMYEEENTPELLGASSGELIMYIATSSFAQIRYVRNCGAILPEHVDLLRGLLLEWTGEDDEFLCQELRSRLSRRRGAEMQQEDECPGCAPGRNIKGTEGTEGTEGTDGADG